MKTVFYKEFRQNSALLYAMLLFCFLLQLALLLSSIFNGVSYRVDFDAVALFTVALYAGAASAISFAGERDDKTFDFLRRLPLTARTIMFGKTCWLLVSTAAMTAGALLMCVFYFACSGFRTGISGDVLWGVFGVSIIEALVWGLFWSPRRKSTVSAVLLTYISAAMVTYLVTIPFGNVNAADNQYLSAVPLRLGICAVVAVFAVQGMLKWFAPETHISYYDTKHAEKPVSSVVRSPFIALTLHCIRQSRIMLLIGVILAVIYPVFSSTFIYVCFLISSVYHRHSGDSARLADTLFLDIFTVCFYLVFCGSIFAPDHKNRTFRILTRFGIAPGKVWLSRMLPFALISLFAACLYIVLHYKLIFQLLAVYSRYRPVYEAITPVFIWTTLIPLFLSFWLIPFAVGSFLSISFRSQIVAVALTGAFSMLLFAWMAAGYLTCVLNPLWFVFPLCAALILASYLRTNNWLKERSGWKVQLFPLLPFALTGVIICAAVPPVRIYSIPFVPLSEIETAMRNAPLGERMPAEKLSELFRQTEAMLDKPLTEEEWKRADWRIAWEWRFENLATHSEPPKSKLKIVKEKLKTAPSFEEALLKGYAAQYRVINAPPDINTFSKSVRKEFRFWLLLYRIFPWEKERALRWQNARLMKQCRQAEDFSEVNWLHSPTQGLFDTDFFTFSQNEAVRYFSTFFQTRIRLVVLALECWYNDHDQTLPKTLDELVKDGYLDSIPIDPLAGGEMLYYPDSDKEKMEVYRKARRSLYDGRNIQGFPHVSFQEAESDDFVFLRNDRIGFLHFLPEYKELQKKE
ncbi:MAG: hypothetical protein FWE67_14485 [Planctomycetaceae bacterium]|nr:hypothetical protein [Planctomycetaceae bacterium]